MPRHGLCVLARSGQPGTGVKHPDTMAADLLDSRGLERRPAQIHPLWGHCDLRRAGADLQHGVIDPGSDSGVVRRVASGVGDGRAASSVRFGRRRRLCFRQHPAHVHRRGRADRRGRIRDVPFWHLRLRSGGSREAGRHHVHCRVCRQLHAEPDSGLCAERHRFCRREGQQGSGPGRAGRRLLAADDPARRSPVTRQPIRARRRSRRATKARSRFSGRASAPPFKPTRSATNS